MKNTTGINIKSILFLGGAYMAMVGLMIVATGNPGVFTF